MMDEVDKGRLYLNPGVDLFADFMGLRASQFFKYVSSSGNCKS